MYLLYPSKEEQKRIRKKEQIKKWQLNHKNRMLEINRNWYKKHSQKKIDDVKKYYKEHPRKKLEQDTNPIY